GEAAAANVIRLSLPFASAVASGLAIAFGLLVDRRRSALVLDLTSILVPFVFVFAFALGPAGRDVIGMLFVVAIAVRFAPAVVLALSAERAWPLLLALTFAVYAAFTAWHQAASLPLGDQVHYLLATDRLAHGSLDATIDPGLFRKLTTTDPTDADVATHVI